MPALLTDLGPLRESVAFRRLFIGQSLSGIGSAMTRVAVPVQVYAVTRSSFAVGLVGLADVVPLVVVGLWGGSVADAVDQRRLVLVTNACLTLTALVLTTQAVAGGRMLALLYGLVALRSAFAAVQAPANRSISARLLGPERQGAVQALLTLSFQLSGVLGPVVAGLVIAGAGLQAAYAADAVSFLAAFWWVLRLPSMPPAGDAGRPGLRAVAEGLRYVRGRPMLLGVLLVDLNATVLGFPLALFPALAATRLGGGARTVGLLYAAVAVGGVLASTVARPVTQARRQGRVLLVAIGVGSLAFAAVGLVHSLLAALALLAVAGVADVVNGNVRGTVVQRETPDRFRGRVTAVGFVVGAGGPSLGSLESGGVASLTSPAVSALSGGLAALAGVVLIGLRLPALWRYDSHHDGPGPGSDNGPDQGGT